MVTTTGNSMYIVYYLLLGLIIIVNFFIHRFFLLQSPQKCILCHVHFTCKRSRLNVVHGLRALTLDNTISSTAFIYQYKNFIFSEIKFACQIFFQNLVFTVLSSCRSSSTRKKSLFFLNFPRKFSQSYRPIATFYPSKGLYNKFDFTGRIRIILLNF